VSENGRSNNSQRGAGREPTTVSSPLDSIADEAVDQAIEDDKEIAEYEPGSKIGRIFPALVGGPQRSGGGILWDPRLLAPPDSDEYKQAIADPSTTLSKRDEKAIHLVNALAPHTQRRD